jgi:hypothetical protein
MKVIHILETMNHELHHWMENMIDSMDEDENANGSIPIPINRIFDSKQSRCHAS